MNDGQTTQSKLQSAVKSIAPQWLIGALRDAKMRRYDVTLVVKRESALKHWFSKHVLRLYYPPSLISRQSAFERWTATRLRHELPTLYHFDIHITDHCNLNCKGCGHFSSLCQPNFLDLEAFRGDMASMAAKLRVEQIYLLGGEPLLHPQVDQFIRVAREYFPDTRICVVTNGSLVMRQKDEFWSAMSETRTVLMCDAYPIGLPVEQIDRKAEETGTLVEWTDARDLFFKVPLDVIGSQDPKDSYRRCDGINNCPMYKDGRLYPCAIASYIDAFKEQFGVDGLEAGELDSISVRDNDSETLAKFISRPIPFCRHCDFDHFEMYKWGRTERKIEEWT